MSHNSVQLRSKAIERNASQFLEYNNLLVFNPPANDDLSYLNPKKIISFDFCAVTSFQEAYPDCVSFSVSHNEQPEYDAALIYLPKSKGELELVLAMLTPMLVKGADIFLIGEKKAGIASAAKKLDIYGANNAKLDSAKHCQLWQVSLDQDVKPFDISEWIETYDVTVKDITFKVATIPGVFSFGALDGGTDLLLNNMFHKLEGRVIDFGCGSGVIGVYTKLLNPEILLEMVDINLLALICAEKTCELNAIDGKVYPSNGWSEVKGRVNGVVTNPPFHSGVSTEYLTTEGFIRESKDKMTKHAPLLLVANSFLRYSEVIEKTFERCDVLAENTKFKIYKTFR